MAQRGGGVSEAEFRASIQEQLRRTEIAANLWARILLLLENDWLVSGESGDFGNGLEETAMRSVGLFLPPLPADYDN